MSAGWAWADATRERALAMPLAGRYRIESVPDDPAYWAAWETAFGRDGFPPDRWLIRDGDRVAAVYRGEQLDGYTYMTGHAAVHLDYRRRGIYRAVIERVLETTRELGFTSVVSNHAPGNNPAIIAKLSLGFRIDRLELDALHGPSLWLRFFHDPDELAAYEFRCGLATLTPELLARRYGAWGRLEQQLSE